MHSDEEIRPNDLARIIKKEKPPGAEKLKDIEPTPRNYKKFMGEVRRPGLPRGIAWGIAGIVVLFVAGSVVSYYVVRAGIKQSVAAQIGTLQQGVADLQDLDPQSAAQEFAALSSSTAPGAGNLLGIFSFLFRGGSQAMASFGDLTQQLTQLAGEVNALQAGVFDFASGKQGSGFTDQLTALRDTLAAIDTDSSQLSTAATSLGSGSAPGGGNFYLPFKTQIEGAKSFLDAFIPWLADPAPHHVLVMLQNTSEMRPGGGFLGSYADVTIANGSIQNIAVHDIADVDAAFKPNIIPPVPLQLENARFRPADANWFFDFPTSASETINYFERSGLYASTTFDGVIAVTPKVVSDLLSVTGPVTVSSTTFTADNLVTQVQAIVQKGQAAPASATYPKAVLGALSQAIFTQLASSTDAEKQELLAMALDWIAKKDVMVYAANPAFENFAAGYGAAGDIYQLPQNFNGEYLAIADADINSDKSELYVAQKVAFDAQINADGTITDTLSIVRTHNGNQSKSWWYETTSQDYLQVFVPDGSSLVTESGGIVKNMPAPLNYAKQGYSTDPLVAAIASSTQSLFIYPAVTAHEEDGREVFATWARVAKGKSTEIDLNYTHRVFLPPAVGVQYQFVFDKQPGSVRSYDFTVDAPLGYVFAGNGLPTYEYTSDDPPGRLIVDLTLQKL